MVLLIYNEIVLVLMETVMACWSLLVIGHLKERKKTLNPNVICPKNHTTEKPLFNCFNG